MRKRDEILEANEDEHKELMLEVGALRSEIAALRAETREALGKGVGQLVLTARPIR